MKWSINDMDIFTQMISENRVTEACKLLVDRGMEKMGAVQYVSDYKKLIPVKDVNRACENCHGPTGSRHHWCRVCLHLRGVG